MIDVGISELLKMANNDCETIQSNLQIVIVRFLDCYDDIMSCVQSYELNKAITVLKSDVEDVCQRLLNSLPRTTEFLKEQIYSYETVQQNAVDNVGKLVNELENILNNNIDDLN